MGAHRSQAAAIDRDAKFAGMRRMEEDAMWIERSRPLWEARLDGLEMVVESLKRKEIVDGRRTK